jgi:hypothetical protein
MKRNKFLKSKLSFLVLISLALVVVGCAKDQTLDEYHQKEVNENLTRMNGVAGKYAGTLTNQATQASMGTIEIDLGTTLVPVNNSDSTQMTTEAALTGRVIINSNYLQGSAQVSNLAYGGLDSSKTGPLTGNINIALSNGTTVGLALSATIANGNLTGTISSNGQGATVVQVGQFSTSLNGPQAGTQGLSTGTNTAGLQRNYNGTIKQTSSSVTKDTSKGSPPAQTPVGVILSTRLTASSPAEWLYENFAQQLNMVVTLVFVHADGASDSQVTFSAVPLDVLSGSFTATGNYSGETNTTVTLSCNQNRGKYDPSATWSCTFYSGENGAGSAFTAVAQN